MTYSPNLYGRLAALYDTVHQMRDYEAEVAFLMGVFLDSGEQPHRLLELFCGTGGHSIPMARKGIEVVGVDRSVEMLDLAEAKAARQGLPVTFEMGDCRALPFRGEFDAAVALGQSVHYLGSGEEILDMLRGASRALVAGGLFILDVVNPRRLLGPYQDNSCWTAEDGTVVARLVRTSSGSSPRTVVAEAVWLVRGADGRVVIDNTTEEYLAFVRCEFEALLRWTGFQLLGVYGEGQLATAATADCLFQTFVAQKFVE
jgi:SAM-dependent methyltransferase